VIRLWATIANKLGISQEEALLLHGLLRGWLNNLARRKALIVVGEIVARFDLDESAYEASYAKQLLSKGILTPTEAEVFAGNFNEDSSGTSAQAAGEDGAGRSRAVGNDRSAGPGTITTIA